MIELDGLNATGKAIFKELQQINNLEVAVGFPRGGGAYEDGTTIAEVAAYNEYGGSDQPARPFLSQAFEGHREETAEALQEAAKSVGDGGAAKPALEKLGVWAVGRVQSEIVEGSFAPNAPSTIKKKGSDKPLIDTGTMRQSVKYVTRPKGGGSK